MLHLPGDFTCSVGACTGTLATAAGATGFTASTLVNSFSFNRGLLGKLDGGMVHITFWSADGKTLLGDFGNYMTGVMGGDVLTVMGLGFLVDPDHGPIKFRFEHVGLGGDGGGEGGGFAGGGGGFGGAPLVSHGPEPFRGGDDNDNESAGAFLRTSSGPASAALTITQAATLVAIVPEPQTWALMLVGFGGLGAMLRRQRTRAALPA
ncbi:MAG: PEPxxWA-CTERM sorting domain-containing protein [Phenylobacterium sp.]